MSLPDDIAFYGRAVDTGELPQTEAVRLLVSAGRGLLSARIAEHLLDHWPSARTGYARLLAEIHSSSARSMGPHTGQTP